MTIVIPVWILLLLLYCALSIILYAVLYVRKKDYSPGLSIMEIGGVPLHIFIPGIWEYQWRKWAIANHRSWRFASCLRPMVIVFTIGAYFTGLTLRI